MVEVLGDFVEILVGGITDLGTGIASGVANMAEKLFITTSTGGAMGLSVFGGLIAIFAGIALAVAITTRVYIWVTSLGN